MSHQAKDRANLQKWKDFVYGRARSIWQGTPLTEDGLRLTLVYLCDDLPADIDNVIKPIQDALIGVVYAEDFQITDVDNHRRFLSEEIDITRLPPLLLQGVNSSKECVYIRVSFAEELHRYL